MPFTYEYPHPAVTVDIIIFAMHEDDLKVLLIQRRNPPFENCWAFPGGFVEIGEGLEDAARRELEEETGVKTVFLEQLYTFGEPKRDPRERVITVAYYTLMHLENLEVTAASDARSAGWFSVGDLPKLAFDHAQIMRLALQRLRAKVLYAPVVFELLPPRFKLPQLQQIYEVILERKLDKRNFRKKMLSTGMLAELPGYDTSQQRRPARLYKFDKQQFKRLQTQGVGFEFKLEAPRKPGIRSETQP